MKELKPMLFTSIKIYSKEKLIKDIIAGIIVAIIALPLSIALALASGVGPQEGIYTAIVAGFIISFLGGSNVQIAGPTAAFATIVAGIVAKNGMARQLITYGAPGTGKSYKIYPLHNYNRLYRRYRGNDTYRSVQRFFRRYI